MGMVTRGLLVGLQTTWTLGKIIFPITLIVTILGYTPVLDWVASMLEPAMGLLGLSGEAAIVLVLGNFLNLYASIGAILTLELTVKEVFIIAMMLSFSHNLIVESAVSSKVGIPLSLVLIVRVGLAIFAAVMINLFWDGGQEIAKYGLVASEKQVAQGWFAIGLEGVMSALAGIIQLAIIVIPLMVLVTVMKEMNWLKGVAKAMKPLTRLLGIKENTSTTLASGLLFGLAYGAGVMIQAVKEDGVEKKDLYLVFIFLLACHAVIEDTLIFIPLGIPVWPLLLIRLITAIVLTLVVAFIWNKVEKNQHVERKEATYEH